MSTQAENLKRVWQTIDEVLWDNWDPQGMNDSEDNRGEYYRYIPEIHELLKTDLTTEELAEELFKICQQRMGLGDMNIRHVCRSTATKLKQIPLE